jgi:hypothetical protein
MPVEEIGNIHYEAIVKSIRQQRCVPFLGAGVNASGDGYEGLPLGREVARHLASSLTGLDTKELEDLRRDAKLRMVKTLARLDEAELHRLTKAEIDEHLSRIGAHREILQLALQDLARIALRVDVEAGPGFLLDKIRQILDVECEPSPVLKTLAGLPFDLMVTTNYDRLLEDALGERLGEKVVQKVSGFNDRDQELMQCQLLSPGGVIVYKMHGSFPDNGPGDDRLVITEEDYIEFLTVVGRTNIGVPELIKGKFVRNTLLFLGYSLEDWDFRALYKVLIEPLPSRSKPVSFAIQRDPSDFWVRYWDRKGVRILKVDLYEFTEELERRFQQSPGGGRR